MQPQSDKSLMDRVLEWWRGLWGQPGGDRGSLSSDSTKDAGSGRAQEGSLYDSSTTDSSSQPSAPGAANLWQSQSSTTADSATGIDDVSGTVQDVRDRFGAATDTVSGVAGSTSASVDEFSSGGYAPGTTDKSDIDAATQSEGADTWGRSGTDSAKSGDDTVRLPDDEYSATAEGGSSEASYAKTGNYGSGNLNTGAKGSLGFGETESSAGDIPSDAAGKLEEASSKLDAATDDLASKAEGLFGGIGRDAGSGDQGLVSQARDSSTGVADDATSTTDQPNAEAEGGFLSGVGEKFGFGDKGVEGTDLDATASGVSGTADADMGRADEDGGLLSGVGEKFGFGDQEAASTDVKAPNADVSSEFDSDSASGEREGGYLSGLGETLGFGEERPEDTDLEASADGAGAPYEDPGSAAVKPGAAGTTSFENAPSEFEGWAADTADADAAVGDLAADSADTADAAVGNVASGIPTFATDAESDPPPASVASDTETTPSESARSGYADGLVGDFGTFGVSDVNVSDLSYLTDAEESAYDFSALNTSSTADGADAETDSSMAGEAGTDGDTSGAVGEGEGSDSDLFASTDATNDSGEMESLDSAGASAYAQAEGGFESTSDTATEAGEAYADDSMAGAREVASSATGDLGVDSVGDLDAGDLGSLENLEGEADTSGEPAIAGFSTDAVSGDQHSGLTGTVGAASTDSSTATDSGTAGVVAAAGATSSSASGTSGKSSAEGPAGSVHGEAGGSCPADYPIKGNGSSKIYHMPGIPSYRGTKAEWCFASEDDAIAAGFRAPGGHRAAGGSTASGPAAAKSATRDAESSASSDTSTAAASDEMTSSDSGASTYGAETGVTDSTTDTSTSSWSTTSDSTSDVGTGDTANTASVDGGVDPYGSVPGETTLASSGEFVEDAVALDAVSDDTRSTTDADTGADQFGTGTDDLESLESSSPDDTAAVTGDAETSSDAAESPAEEDSIYSGAVRGDGTRICPTGYLIKGNAGSMIYHAPGRSSYDATIAEWCFATEEDALNAGFRAPKR